jgi:hypothetical protein
VVVIQPVPELVNHFIENDGTAGILAGGEVMYIFIVVFAARGID